MDDVDLAHWRMRTVGLSGEPFAAPEDVVRWFGAVQSQDYGPAKWSIGQRTAGATDAALDEAFDAGRILRTHVLRPTWHFVLPEDIRWLLRLTAPRVHAQNAYYYRTLGLDDGVFGRCHELIAGALAGGGQLTRKELADVLTGAGIALGGFRPAYILMHAELEGLICSGARRGRQHTYALLDERVPDAPQPDRDEALAALALRYFTSHGPATVKDFTWWSSLTAADADRALRLLDGRLDRMVIGGVTYRYADPAPRSRPPSPVFHLLQGYDEYIVAFAESKYVLDAAGSARALPAAATIPNGVVICDGQVAGHWKRTVRSTAVTVETLLYEPPDMDRRKALSRAAERHGQFLGLPVTVTTGGLPDA